jgi:hypothetical protein
MSQKSVDFMTQRVTLSLVMDEQRHIPQPETGRSRAMATKSEGMFAESFTSVQGKVLEAMSVFAQANERVMGELIELSSATAREGLRAFGELQAAAVETARAVPLPSVGQGGEMIEDLRRDPLAWYRKGFQALADSTQRAAKLVETNAQIVARNAERFQASADRAAKGIEQAASGYVSSMKDIYTRHEPRN